MKENAKEKELVNEEIDKQNAEEVPEDKSGLIRWIKANKEKLLFAGVTATVLFALVLGAKNKEAVMELWEELKEKIEKGSLYSPRWFEKSSIEELQDARELVQADCMNPELDVDYRSYCHNLLNRFDNAIGNKRWDGKEYEFPVHSEHGWHLSEDDD